jgi:hypothetical protein
LPTLTDRNRPLPAVAIELQAHGRELVQAEWVMLGFRPQEMIQMRNVRNHHYEGIDFAAEKMIATLYLIMYVLIVANGMGVHTQSLRIAPDPATSPIETRLR